MTEAEQAELDKLCTELRNPKTRMWQYCTGRCTDSDPATMLHYRRMLLGAAADRFDVSSSAPPAQPIAPQAVQKWGTIKQIVQASKAFARFALDGFKWTPAEIAAARLEICKGCERWTGTKCGVCGCTKLKYDMPSETCPLSPPKWLPVPTKPLISSWAVAIHTAPRTGDPSKDLIADLRVNGWNEPHVFAEPGCPSYDATMHVNEQRLGAWRNKFQAFKWLLEHSDAEAILVCEDDIRIASGTRLWLDFHGWPSKRTAVLSLYRVTGRMRGEPGKEWWQDTDQICDAADPRGYARVKYAEDIWGSCAIAMPQFAVELLVADPTVHAEMRDGEFQRFSDLRLRRWCWSKRLEWWVCRPSRVQHRQDVESSLGHGTAGRSMCAEDYIGNDEHGDDEIGKAEIGDASTRSMWPV